MNKARTIRVIVIAQLDQAIICLITAAPKALNPKTPNSSKQKPAQAKVKKPPKAKTETLSTPPPPQSKTSKAPVSPNTDPLRSTEARRSSEFPENPTPTKSEPTPFEFQKKNYSSFQRDSCSLKMSRLKSQRAVRMTYRKSSE